MDLLKTIDDIKTEGYTKSKIVRLTVKEACNWEIYCFEELKIFVLEENILIELEDGTNHSLKSGEDYIIAPNTFFRISPENDSSKFFKATRIVEKLYGT